MNEHHGYQNIINPSLFALAKSCRPPLEGKNPVETLFPLEKDSSEGKKLERRTSALPGYPELDPDALKMSYLDKSSGLLLPVFCAFSLQGPSEFNLEIGHGGAQHNISTSGSPIRELPWEKVYASYEEKEDQRLKGPMARRLVARITLIVCLLLAMASVYPLYRSLRGPVQYLVYRDSVRVHELDENISFQDWLSEYRRERDGADVMAGLATVVVAAAGVFLGYVVSTGFGVWDGKDSLGRLLVLKAKFDGLVPTNVRQKAREVQNTFERLYLITDQQTRWEVSWAPMPLPPADLDPLLVGSKCIDGKTRFFLVDCFNLTDAERYITDEFC